MASILSHVAVIRKFKGEPMLQRYPYACIDADTYEISEFGGTSSFLLVGKEKALLIDTGVGIGDLAFFVHTLTQKPIEVFITHNHRDHVGNAPRFGKIHMSPLDVPFGSIICPWTSQESRLRFATDNCTDRSFGFFWETADIESFSPDREPEREDLADGLAVDLGGRTVTWFQCPGHTPGSCVAIDGKTGMLFCGDACNRRLGIGVRPLVGVRLVSIESALRSMRRIWDMDFDRKRIFNGHTDYRKVGQPLDGSVWESLMGGMQNILDNDFVLRKVWIQNLNRIVETAVFSDVEIQFQTSNIHDQQRD